MIRTLLLVVELRLQGNVVFADGPHVLRKGTAPLFADQPLSHTLPEEAFSDSVSVREDVESAESPVIPWGGGMQEAADVDAGEPPPLRP